MTKLTANTQDCLGPGFCRAPQFMAEIKQLRTENIDRLLQKGKLEDEIQRLKSSPTTTEADELIARLLAQVTDDHERGCMGRNYGCTCGYDEKTEKLMDEAAEALHRLARNQITASHTTIAQAAAFQAQHADATRGTSTPAVSS